MISFLNEFRDIYYKGGIRLLFHEYIRKVLIIVGTVFSFTVIITLLIHYSFLRITGSQLLLSIGSLSFTVTLLVAILVLLYPLNKKNEMIKKTEEGLLYTLSYMTVLSASGLGIENIMERVAEIEDNPSIRQLATKFIMNMKVFGMNVTTSLNDVSNRSGSETFTSLIESINNNIQTSGELKNLFMFELERAMQKKRDEIKKVLNNLTNLGELYVALLIVGPILFIIILTLLSLLGSSASGSSILQLNLITFFGIPLLATGFILVLDATIGGVE